MKEKVEVLFRLLAQNTVAPNTLQLISKLCAQMDADNQQDALATHAEISRLDWEPNKDWLVPLKRLLNRK